MLSCVGPPPLSGSTGQSLCSLQSNDTFHHSLQAALDCITAWTIVNACITRVRDSDTCPAILLLPSFQHGPTAVRCCSCPPCCPMRQQQQQAWDQAARLPYLLPVQLTTPPATPPTHPHQPSLVEVCLRHSLLHLRWCQASSATSGLALPTQHLACQTPPAMQPAAPTTAQSEQ